MPLQENPRVLVAHDLMSHSDRALGRGAELAATARAELHVVHVLPASGCNSERATDRLVATAKRVIGDSAVDVLYGPPFFHVSYGDARPEICDLARAIGAGLIVIGMRTPTDLRGARSAEAPTLRGAPCPVLVVPGRRPAKGGLSGRDTLASPSPSSTR